MFNAPPSVLEKTQTPSPLLLFSNISKLRTGSKVGMERIPFLLFGVPTTPRLKARRTWMNPLDAPSVECYPVEMALTSIAAATTILANATKLLDSLREQSKSTKDVVLKENISKLYDHFLDLKAALLRVAEENAELKGLLKEAEKTKPEIKQVGLTHYYFVDNEGPYCQPCYDRTGKLVPMAPQDRYAGGVGRRCNVCEKTFFETHEHQQRSITPYGW